MVAARETPAVLLAAGALAVACGSNSGHPDAGIVGTLDASGAADGGGDAAPEVDAAPATNVAPVVVDNGPNGVQAVNTLYTTVTLCRPGTTTCQTIDHVEVDTGSSGMRIIASVLDATLMLPAQMAADGNPLVECYQYVDGYNWGPVATADLQIGGETAASVPIQIVGGPGLAAAPSDCSSVGSQQDTVMALGGNGLLGIGYDQADCGNTCASATPRSAAYYSCTSNACTVASVPVANQVQNPVGLLPTDNNGVAVQLPTIDPAGAASVRGSLIFGIGTAANNGLGAAQVITIDAFTGYFTTAYGGSNLTSSFIDTGSLSYAFSDTNIAQCMGSNLAGFFCPPMSLSLMATNLGHNDVRIATPFAVAAADGLYASGNAAFNDLALTAFTPGYFDWGLPFFYGRTVFTAISGAATPGGTGPYFAY